MCPYRRQRVKLDPVLIGWSAAAAAKCNRFTRRHGDSARLGGPKLDRLETLRSPRWDFTCFVHRNGARGDLRHAAPVGFDIKAVEQCESTEQVIFCIEYCHTQLKFRKQCQGGTVLMHTSQQDLSNFAPFPGFRRHIQ